MKASDNEIKIFLQKLEQDRAPDLSKMNSHWGELEKALPASSPTTPLVSILKYRSILIGAAAFLVFLSWILLVPGNPSIENRPPRLEVKKVKVSEQTPDTMKVSRAVDTPGPIKAHKKKSSTYSQRVATAPSPDTISSMKGKVRFARPIPDKPIRKRATLTIDSMN
jgi:hypothetical protein